MTDIAVLITSEIIEIADVFNRYGGCIRRHDELTRVLNLCAKEGFHITKGLVKPDSVFLVLVKNDPPHAQDSVVINCPELDNPASGYIRRDYGHQENPPHVPLKNYVVPGNT